MKVNSSSEVSSNVSHVTPKRNAVQTKVAATESNTYGQFDRAMPNFDHTTMVSAHDLRQSLTAKRMNVKEARHQSNQPVKVYSDTWWEKQRPSGAINSDKKVVDNKLVEIINLQRTIEVDTRDKLQETHTPMLVR